MAHIIIETIGPSYRIGIMNPIDFHYYMHQKMLKEWNDSCIYTDIDNTYNSENENGEGI